MCRTLSRYYAGVNGAGHMAAIASGSSSRLLDETGVQPLLACVLPLFGSTIFLGALLVFGVQPIAARLLLPWFGGSPAVWSAAAVFFQVALLAGYGYSYALTRRLAPRRQPLLHALALLAPLVFLPISLPIVAAAPADVPPELAVLGLLTLGLGAPFTVASTTGPLLQRWFSLSGHRSGGDPYFLYAASNAGSLLVLLAYPVIIEPNLTLAEQSTTWSIGYVAFAAAAALCGAVVWRRAARQRHVEPVPTTPGPTPSWRARAGWIMLAAVPSALSLGATNFISTDIAAVPLLWIAPLALYLASFIVAFARRPVLTSRRAGLALLPLAAILALSMTGVLDLPVPAEIATHLAFLFVAAVMCHGRMAEQRPDPAHLTEFYLLMSVGGALGGIFVSLVAPMIFDRVWEYPIAIVAVLALRPAFPLQPSLRLIGHRAAAAAAMGIVLAVTTLGSGNTIYTDRTFFGVYRVIETDTARQLVNGTTVHGTQLLDPQLANLPSAYYHPSGPIGDVFSRHAASDDDVALVGLGIGNLAAYADAGDHFTFYEIDPGMVTIARDSGLFSFLAAAEGTVDVEVADGRLGLLAAQRQFDLIVLDAFISDAVPAHLMTVEALSGYLDKLRSGGLVAMHISNRNLDLEPVLAATLAEVGVPSLTWVDADVSAADAAQGKSASQWVIFTPDAVALSGYDGGWRPLRIEPDVAAWTDDRSDILSALR